MGNVGLLFGGKAPIHYKSKYSHQTLDKAQPRGVRVVRVLPKNTQIKTDIKKQI